MRSRPTLSRKLRRGRFIVLTALIPGAALADPPTAVSAAAAPAPPGSSPPQTATLVVVKPDPLKDPVKDTHFSVDPVADGVLIAAGGGTAGILELILSTGELVPQRPGPTNNLLSFDRDAVTQTVDPNAALFSNIGLTTAIAFAGVDTLFSGIRDGWAASLVDGMMYAESISLTLTLTDFTKLAVRRPRPLAYTEQAALDKMCPTPTLPNQCPTISSTDTQLSFFSGHAAMTAAIGATATYVAFVRAPHSPRPWITMAAGILLTGFVSVERVRAGAHFPTDVIAGSLFGAAVGVLVPHLHRRKEESVGVWIGLAPAPGGGGTASLQGVF
jgi:membrane-associated phospholipid phosphatase